MNFDFGGSLEKQAIKWLAEQEIHSGDYYDSNGMLICGTCHSPRQTMVEIGDRHFKATCMCKCESESYDAEQRKLKAEAHIQELRRDSCMSVKQKEATFASAKITKNNQDSMRKCKRYAERFKDLPEKNMGLLLYGDVGTGKSHAAACIANYLLDKEISVVMIPFVNAIERFMSDTEEIGEFLPKIDYAKLVIFDDFGAERDTGYSIEKAYSLIDRRYRTGLPMIITTNLSLAEMQNELKNGEDSKYKRTYERIIEVCHPVQFTGPSWRQFKAHSSYNEMEDFLGQ